MKYRLFLFTLLSFAAPIVRAQDNILDSLNTLLRSETIDSNKVNILNEISWEYRIKGNMKEAMNAANEALELAENADYQPGLAYTYNSIALVYTDQGNYPKAIDYCKKSIEIAKEIRDDRRTASAYNNLGIIYNLQADHANAIECYREALKILDKLGSKNSVAALYNNIGIIYYDQKKYTEALEYYGKALETRTALKDAYGIGSAYINIGEVHHALKHFVTALDHYHKAYDKFSSVDSKQGLGICANGIGSLYTALTEEPDSTKQSFVRTSYADAANIPALSSLNESLLDSALKWRLTALRFSYEAEKKLTRTYSLNGIADIMRKKKQYKQAVSFYRMAFALSDSITAQESLMDASKGLYESYQEIGRYDSALFWFRESTRIRDTLYSSEKQVDFARQEARMAYDKEMAVIAEQRKQQQIITYSIAGGLGMMFLFSIVVVGRLKVTRKQKRTIEDQKALVDEKNKNILDSINYAKRIQDALLKEADSSPAHLPAHFIFNQPKDIVSGDFYWSMEKQGHWYLAAADCTGHGVPGALMSMLGMAFLNEINATDKLYTPAEILDQLRDKVVKELRQSGKEGGSKDGMDISLLRLDTATKQMLWAGANNPIYVLQNLSHRIPGDKDKVHNATDTVLHEIRPDKQPIGFHPNHRNFTDHSLQLHEGDSLYLFTDGYADQFGGEKGKKFKYSQLKDLFLSIHQKPVAEQKEIIGTTFRRWQGEFEQIDDVCVIGVKIGIQKT